MHQLETTSRFSLPVVELNDVTAETFVTYYHKNRHTFEEILTRNGAVKFKGVQIGSQQNFAFITDSIAGKFLSYVDGNSPRTKLSDHVYTSTEYDKTQKITMHNELSYSAKWPGRLFFSCLQPAESGGETLLVDSRELLTRLDPDIVAEVKAKGIAYIRNLHGGMGFGKSWQETFETDSRQKVEEYCKARRTSYEWKEDDGLRLRQYAPGIVEHRKSGEQAWFNQLDQFHPYQLGAELSSILADMYDTHFDYPSYVTFGDGTVIGVDLVREVIRTTDECTIAPPWQRSELLVVDNEICGHGRNPFSGDRTVLVSMAE